MSFWNDMQHIDNQIKSGELDLAGRLPLPKSGEAILFALETEPKEGRNYIIFYLTLEGNDNYRKFEVRCPIASDADNTKYMGMQNIYKCLFGAMKRDPKTHMIDKVYSELYDFLKMKSIKVSYECEETKFISQKGAKAGTEITATFLRSITGIAQIPKVAIEVKKKESPAAQAWDTATEEVPF